MPPRGKRKAEPDNAMATSSLLERLAAVRAEPLLGTPYKCSQFPNFHRECSVIQIGDEGYYVVFYTGQGKKAAARLPVDVSDETLGLTIQFALTEGRSIPWDTLRSLPPTITGGELIHPSVSEDPQAEKALLQSLKHPNLKHMLAGLISSNSGEVVLKPISVKDTLSIPTVDEAEDVVKIEGAITCDGAGLLGRAAKQRCRLALSSEEAKLHPDSKYKGGAPTKLPKNWAKMV